MKMRRGEERPAAADGRPQVMMRLPASGSIERPLRRIFQALGPKCAAARKVGRCRTPFAHVVASRHAQASSRSIEAGRSCDVFRYPSTHTSFIITHDDARRACAPSPTSLTLTDIDQFLPPPRTNKQASTRRQPSIDQGSKGETFKPPRSKQAHTHTDDTSTTPRRHLDTHVGHRKHQPWGTSRPRRPVQRARPRGRPPHHHHDRDQSRRRSRPPWRLPTRPRTLPPPPPQPQPPALAPPR